MNTTLRSAIVPFLIFVLCGTGSLEANSKAGTYAYSFLKIPAGAKAPSMGGAHAALSHDAYGVYYNPAGISQIEGSEITGSYNNYLADIQGGFVSYVFDWSNRGKLGMSVNYLNHGSTPRTDEIGNDLGEFGGGDIAIALTFARRWVGEADESAYQADDSGTDSFPGWSGLGFGVSTKFIYESIDDYSSDGIALDLGLIYALKDQRTRLGFSATNLGFQLKGLSSGHKDPIPGIVRLGIAHRLKAAPFTVAVDGVQPFDNDIHVAAGVNFTQFQPVELRAGYSTLGEDYKTGSDSDNFGGLTFGFGLKLKQVTLDYAFLPFADLGTSHRIALSSGW